MASSVQMKLMVGSGLVLALPMTIEVVGRKNTSHSLVGR